MDTPSCMRIRFTNASFGFGNAPNGRRNSNNVTTMTEHAKKNKKIRLFLLKFSGKADLICWHSQLTEDIERDDNSGSKNARKISGRKCVAFHYGIGQKVAEMTIRNVCPESQHRDLR